MNGQGWLTNSEDRLEEFIQFVRDTWHEHKWVTWYWITGQQRKLNQNALFQVWSREFAAYLAKCKIRDVTVAMHEDMKLALKKAFYADTAQEFMVRRAYNPITKKESKTVASSTELDRGQFFMFMEWVQAFAATKGLFLEAMGEYKELKNEGA